MPFLRFGTAGSHFEGTYHVAGHGHTQYRASLRLPSHVETRVPWEEPLVKLGEALEACFGFGCLSCGAPSPAWWSQLKPEGKELSQLSWGALLGRLSGPFTVCYYFYKGGSVCWIMFGQLLMHSRGRGWVGTLLLYFQTVDLCAWGVGREWKEIRLEKRIALTAFSR